MNEYRYKGHTIRFEREVVDDDDAPFVGLALYVDGNPTGSVFTTLDGGRETAEWMIDRGLFDLTTGVHSKKGVTWSP